MGRSVAVQEQLEELTRSRLLLHVPTQGIPAIFRRFLPDTLEIVETEPAMKGQTASGSFKPAILSNGVRTSVPTHIVTGTRIVVLTEDGSYVERAKE